MAKSRSRKLADLLSGSSELLTADRLDVSGNGTSGQVLQSDGDGSFSWVDISSGNFKEVIPVTTNKTITAEESGKTLVIGASGLTITLPQAQEGLIYAIVNELNEDLLINVADSSDSISTYGPSVFVPALKSSIFVGQSNSKWRVIGETFRAIKLTDLSGTGTFTPDSRTVKMLVSVTGGGGSGRGSYGGVITSGGAGGGYAEKLYNSPTGSFSYSVGGTSGTSTFDVLTANGGQGATGTNTPSVGGTGSGGDFNASGGSGVPGGGAGAAGSRAGDGGDGFGSYMGGTGGDATANSHGPAANLEAAGTFNINQYVSGTFEFQAGDNYPGANQSVWTAGSGQRWPDNFTDFDRNEVLILGGQRDGVGGGARSLDSFGRSGSYGSITVLELFS